MVALFKSRAVVKTVARTALLGSIAVAGAQIALTKTAQAQPDATSYSYRYAPAGSIGRHEVRTITTDIGTMSCNGGGDRAYTGRGYQPNDGVGRNFYRVPGNDQPTGGARSCRWTSVARPQLREPAPVYRQPAPPVRRPAVQPRRVEPCTCRNGG